MASPDVLDVLDVLVIGSGQAGVPLASRLAAAGKRVVVVERGHVGGTCVNAGCTPTKMLVASARAAHVVRTSARLGVRVGEVTVDFAAVMARKSDVVRRWRAGSERRLTTGGERLRLVRGHARFVAPRTVEVNGDRYEGTNVVINVGARPAVPELAGLADVGYLTSTSALELTELPRRLLILGAGYIACELGQMFRRLGAEVVLVAPSARVLPREDAAASEALAGVFRAEDRARARSTRRRGRARRPRDRAATGRRRVAPRLTPARGDGTHAQHRRSRLRRGQRRARRAGPRRRRRAL